MSGAGEPTCDCAGRYAEVVKILANFVVLAEGTTVRFDRDNYTVQRARAVLADVGRQVVRAP